MIERRNPFRLKIWAAIMYLLVGAVLFIGTGFFWSTVVAVVSIPLIFAGCLGFAVYGPYYKKWERRNS